MELIFTIVLLILVILLYISNPKNMINKWFAIAAFICWLGAAKEAVLFNIIPFLETALEVNNLADRFKPLYSLQTWALYSFAMPAMIIFSLYFCNMDVIHPKALRIIKAVIWIPAIALSFFFPPLNFRFYQLNSRAFVIAYSAYNLCLGVVFTFLLIKGVRDEKPGRVKTQKKYLLWCALAPVLFWLLSATLPYLFEIPSLYKLWQGNLVILIICCAGFIILAFKDGFMGLRLTRETYNWNSDMNLVSKGAEYTSHMLKNQTAKMEWCIENLKSQYAAQDTGESSPEELEILSRSIATLKSYIEKAKKYSGMIYLIEEPCNLSSLLDSAIPPYATPIETSISDDVYWVCDKMHMTEVFSNILTNAAEAMRGDGAIEIRGGYDRRERFYRLSFTDHGDGMDSEDVTLMFTPYFTTKNTERNFGLGLSYCKNVVEKHDGHIRAESEPGKGTTVTIELPARRVASSKTARAEDSHG